MSGTGWVREDLIETPKVGRGMSITGKREVAYGGALAKLREDKKRLDSLLRVNARLNAVMMACFGRDPYGQPETREDLDAWIARVNEELA